MAMPTSCMATGSAFQVIVRCWKRTMRAVRMVNLAPGAAYIFDLADVTTDATSWQNPTYPFNVDNDPADNVSPIDVLLIINELNRTGARELLGVGPQQAEGSFYDVSGDRFILPVDALIIINFLNSQSVRRSEAEGEGMQRLSFLPRSSKDNSRLNATPQPSARLLDVVLAEESVSFSVLTSSESSLRPAIASVCREMGDFVF
jgi:Dockerin type I domain